MVNSAQAGLSPRVITELFSRCPIYAAGRLWFRCQRDSQSHGRRHSPTPVQVSYCDLAESIGVSKSSAQINGCHMVIRYRRRPRRVEKLFHSCQVRLVVTIIDIEIHGDTAIEYGWHEWTLTAKPSGKKNIIRERDINIWRRQADGGWKLSLYINSADHAPEMADSLRALESAAMKALLAEV
jgi:hypothetical protein